MTLETAAAMSRLRWTSAASAAEGLRTLAEETPVALTHDGSTTAVMMATPADLEDFGVGFSLTEGLVETPDEIGELEIVVSELGVEVRMWLAGERAARLAARRRRLAGPTGCGLCGLDSLAEAARPTRRVDGGDARVTAP